MKPPSVSLDPSQSFAGFDSFLACSSSLALIYSSPPSLAFNVSQLPVMASSSIHHVSSISSSSLSLRFPKSPLLLSSHSFSSVSSALYPSFASDSYLQVVVISQPSSIFHRLLRFLNVSGRKLRESAWRVRERAEEVSGIRRMRGVGRGCREIEECRFSELGVGKCRLNFEDLGLRSEV